MFHFFCSRDYLQITNEKNRVFGKYCGHMTGKTVFISGQNALIKFHSDSKIQNRGFLMSFLAVVPPCKKWQLNGVYAFIIVIITLKRVKTILTMLRHRRLIYFFNNYKTKTEQIGTIRRVSARVTAGVSWWGRGAIEYGLLYFYRHRKCLENDKKFDVFQHTLTSFELWSFSST